MPSPTVPSSHDLSTQANQRMLGMDLANKESISAAAVVSYRVLNGNVQLLVDGIGWGTYATEQAAQCAAAHFKRAGAIKPSMTPPTAEHHADSEQQPVP